MAEAKHLSKLLEPSGPFTLLSTDDESKIDETTGLKGVSYSRAKLGGEIIKLMIPKYEELFKPTSPWHPFYQHHDRDFDADRLQSANLPLHVGSLKVNYQADQVVNVLRVPVKQTGSREIILPKECEFLKEFITFCCVYECSFNPRFDELYGHLTVDYKEFTEGQVHRVPGWHVDGFQGCKFPVKHEIEHSYLWTDNLGTEFCVQPFFVSHIDDSKYLIFDELIKQAKEENVYTCLPKNLYIFDPYMVHRSPVAKRGTQRLLVRLTFEYQKLLDPNDTQNPELKFKIPYKFDIRNRLGEYTVPLDTKMYGYIEGSNK